MSTPDYRAFLSGKGTEPAYVMSINEVASLVSGELAALISMTQGDPDKINSVIDRMIDNFIEAAGGDKKLAVFGALAAYGQSMRLRFGPPGGG